MYKRFTRTGDFTLDSDLNLVKVGDGGRLQGFGINNQFNIVEGTVQDINIPIGVLTVAEATQTVRFAVNLNADATTFATAGRSMSATGEMVIRGNSGTLNDITIRDDNIIVNQATNPTVPFTFTKLTSTDGKSVRTSFISFDSLGTAMVLDLNIVLKNQTNTGTQWRFYTQSEDDTDLDRALGTGTLTFDTGGELLTVVNPAFTIDRDNMGASTPPQITLDFNDLDSALSALTDTRSELAPTGQDGSPIGTLEDFTTQVDGTIVGVFSNGEQRDLGQVVLAMFANNNGLLERGDNLFEPSANSGTATIVTPGSAGSGRILDGALELSNVELIREFVNLITYSTGFAANSRVITTTTDRMIQELLAATRQRTT